MSVISHTASGKPQLLYIAAHNSHWRMKCRLKKQKCLLILSNVTSTKLICASVLIIAQCSLKLRVWVNCRCNLSHLANRIIISSPSGCVAENFQFASWLGEWCARLDPFSSRTSGCGKYLYAGDILFNTFLPICYFIALSIIINIFRIIIFHKILSLKHNACDVPSCVVDALSTPIASPG